MCLMGGGYWGLLGVNMYINAKISQCLRGYAQTKSAVHFYY
jgi:hypothetical protein